MRASVLSRGLVVAVARAMIGVFGASAAPASATPGAWWHLDSSAFPTQLQPGGNGYLAVSAINRGYENVDGASSPIVLTDALPPGVEVTAAAGTSSYSLSGRAVETTPFPCSFTAHSVSCEYEGAVQPYSRVWILITVKVASGASPGEVSEVSVSGGGAAAKTLHSPLDATGGEPKYGLEKFELAAEEAGGGAATQAGGHPYQLTTTIGFDRTERVAFVNPNKKIPLEPAPPREVNVKLPPGLIGNPTPFPQCTAAQFTNEGEKTSNACPEDTAVGYANITIDTTQLYGVRVFRVPVFNLAPDRGEPARFGFTVEDSPVYLDTSVRTGGDYGITVHVGNITQVVALLESEVTFWGVPGDPRHDNSRGWWCGVSEAAESGLEPCKLEEQKNPQPLLVMPTSCTGELQASVETDSWREPSNVLTYGPSSPMSAMDGCNRLGFEPKVSVTPDGQAASSPSGLGVDVHVPQAESQTPTGLSESNVKDTTVALPAGLALNPSAADGLQSCSLEQISLNSDTPPGCPEAAKVGTVTIHTPLLPEPLTGAAYLATQDANPFGSLVALYVVAEDPQSGVLIKLAGEVHLSETGQIVSTFKNTPQLPFEDFELDFFGGARAPLATPSSCGSYTTQASLSPWSGTEAVASSSTFEITSGPNASPCPSSTPFSPSLTGGTTNLQAGAFSPLVTTISREDGQQQIQSLQLHMPAGLLGTLRGVKLCGEGEANAGTCTDESLIGHTVVSVGLGGDPYSVTGGRVYLTGPYEGAPFGLSIVNPAVAGPFNLGNVIVRAKVEVDPHSSALTITTDSSGPYKIPTILDGIPLQIKHVNVTIDRPGFTFNPTNCNPQAITGSVASSAGTSSPVSVPFQVTNCKSLAFTPKFAVSTPAKSTKASGAGLNVKLTYPSSPQGSQADIAKVKVALPVQLPSQLKTLQKACLSKVFEENPAKCPKESVVGHATVNTPVLPVPLTGPAYFVSHGGEAFPALTIVLQGYGVTVDLVGSTFIRNGITTTTFGAVPDVPFSSFELTLPQGQYAALGANLPESAKGSFCGQKLTMPTQFVAQDGAEIKQSTPVEVQGCANAISLASKSFKHGAGGRPCRRKAERLGQGLAEGLEELQRPRNADGEAARQAQGQLQQQDPAALRAQERKGDDEGGPGAGPGMSRKTFDAPEATYGDAAVHAYRSSRGWQEGTK
jgi:hypothetical protein